MLLVKPKHLLKKNIKNKIGKQVAEKETDRAEQSIDKNILIRTAATNGVYDLSLRNTTKQKPVDRSEVMQCLDLLPQNLTLLHLASQLKKHWELN